jgi:hypothetical protein
MNHRLIKLETLYLGIPPINNAANAPNADIHFEDPYIDRNIPFEMLVDRLTKNPWILPAIYFLLTFHLCYSLIFIKDAKNMQEHLMLVITFAMVLLITALSDAIVYAMRYIPDFRF